MFVLGNGFYRPGGRIGYAESGRTCQPSERGKELVDPEDHRHDIRPGRAATDEDVLAFLLDNPPADNVLDTRFLGLLVSGIIGLRARRRLPLIKAAYEKNYIEEFLVGTLDSVISDISLPLPPVPKTLSIVAQYRAYQRDNDGTNVEWRIVFGFPPLMARLLESRRHGSGWDEPSRRLQTRPVLRPEF